MRRLILLALLLAALPALGGCDPRPDQYRAALRRLLNNDPVTAAALLTTLGETGYAPAQFRLGLLYRLGLGVPRNARQAVYWFDKAARQGEVGAQYHLAMAYQQGDGAPRSPELAFHGFHRLAEQRYAPAQYQIALAYEKGQGVKRDDPEAVAWLQRAATGGHAEAAQRLVRAYRNGELGLLPDPRQAQRWERQLQPPRF